jgi:predicted lipid-binding transport protein (Tim44 family)
MEREHGSVSGVLRGSLVALLAAWMALAPGLAEARAGGGSSSSGSRGSRTYESNSARPMERSVTPQSQQPSSSAPRSAAPLTPALGAPASFMQSHPFLSGLAGGFIGAGIAGMLFGNSAWPADGGMGSGLGILLQLLVIAGLIYFAMRLFRSWRQDYVTAGAGAGYPRSVGALASPAARGDPVAIPLSEADYNEWSALLVGIQDAWSKSDILRMRQFMTPEMVGYFNDELARMASQDVENRVEQVNLLKGDVEEAWREGGEFEYVTARLRWSALDYKLRSGTSQVVEGDPNSPVEASEVWTFLRARGGKWLLSAIQQV